MNQNTIGLTLLGAAALVASCSSSSSGGKKPLTGDQTGAATVDLGTEGVKFSQPKQIKVDGTAVYDDVLDTVILSLTITNKSKSVLHNPKVVITGLTEGTVTGDGSFGPSPAEGAGPAYVYFGPESIPTNGTASRDIEVTGVTGVDPELMIDFEILVHPWIFVPANEDGVVATDSSGAGHELFLFDLGEIEDLGWQFDSWQRGDAVSPDTRYVYYTNRNQPAIITFDTVDHTLEIGESLIGGTIAHDGTGVVGCMDGLTTSPDGETLYATISHGAHIASFTGDFPTPTEIEVVKLDAQTLSIQDRVTVWTPPPVLAGAPEGVVPPYNPEIRGREMSLTPDGNTGALSITGASEVVMLNLSNMTVLDTFATSGFSPRHAAINADASTIAVCYTWRDDSDGTLELIDTATGDLTPLVPDTLDAGTSTFTPFLRYGPVDDRLYFGRAWNAAVPGVSIYDPVGDTWNEIAGYGNAIRFTDDGWCIWDDNTEEVRCFDYADAELTFPATGLTGITVANGSFGHGFVFTE